MSSNIHAANIVKCNGRDTGHCSVCVRSGDRDRDLPLIVDSICNVLDFLEMSVGAASLPLLVI